MNEKKLARLRAQYCAHFIATGELSGPLRAALAKVASERCAQDWHGQDRPRCGEAGCERSMRVRGFCQRHYQRKLFRGELVSQGNRGRFPRARAV